MFLKRLYCNKYVFGVELFLNNVKCYGFKNAVSTIKRRNINDYNAFKNSFKTEYSLKLFDLIEKRIGNAFKIGNCFDMGYCFYGPVIFEFVKWICDNSKECDELLFLAREGWLLKKAFEIYGDSNKAVSYFLTSRRAVSVASIECENDIRDILSIYYKGRVSNLLSSRLGFSYTKEDFYVEMPQDIEKVMALVDIERVVLSAKDEKNNYCKYFNATVKGRKTAVIDIGYSCTIQYYMNKLFNRKFDGLYLSTHFNNRTKNMNYACKSLFPVVNMLDEIKNVVFKNQLYFEAVLKAPFGQLLFFDENVEPVYGNDNAFNEDIEQIQQGICSFIQDIKDIKDIENGVSLEIFDFMLRNKCINSHIIDKLKVEDSYCSDGSLNVGKE